MLIKSKLPSDIGEDQVTEQAIYHDRRRLLRSLGFVGASALLASHPAQAIDWFSSDDDEQVFNTKPLTFDANQGLSTDETPTSKLKATTHNNFYEFGTGKSDPVDNAQSFQVDPWTLKVEGLVEKNVTLGYEDFSHAFALEERIYRLRCVEAWSMVIPWIGFPLAQLLKQATPLSSAKYVAFETLYEPKQMPGQKSRWLGGGVDYPYVEGLRLDEAMHPLTLMAVGMYGESLPAQNGAPIRLVVPWKYGFKSIKSIVSIKLTDKKPPTTWNLLAPNEYGFYANVNPAVDHPRWSQASERRITTGGLLSRNRIATKPFNGYEEVASLYSDMDLRRYY